MVRVVGAILLLVGVPLSVGAQAVVDTVVVDATPTWGDEVELIEELRIGTLLGDPNQEFGLIGGVLELDDGTIWVGDRHLGAIRRFGPSGEFLGQVGREGQGPGEFRYPQGMRQLPSGQVAVWDDGQIRVSFFSAEGEFLSSFTPPTFMIGTPMEEFELDRPTGDLYLMSGTIPSTAPADRRLYWLRLTTTGEVIDTVEIERSEAEGLIDPRRTVTTLSPLGYRVTGRNDEYALLLERSPSRHTLLVRPWRPVSYKRAEREEKQRLAEVSSDRRGQPAGRVPETKPAFSTVHVDEVGRLWVELYAEGVEENESEGEKAVRADACQFFGIAESECERGARRWHEPAVFEVLGPDGTFFGRLELPNRRTTFVGARADRLWVVETGVLGEQYVVRYRLAKN